MPQQRDYYGGANPFGTMAINKINQANKGKSLGSGADNTIQGIKQSTGAIDAMFGGIPVSQVLNQAIDLNYAIATNLFGKQKPIGRDLYDEAIKSNTEGILSTMGNSLYGRNINRNIGQNAMGINNLTSTFRLGGKMGGVMKLPKYNLGGVMQGGNAIPLSEDGALMKGNTHEQGGIVLGNTNGQPIAEVENNEVTSTLYLPNNDKQEFVFSASITNPKTNRLFSEDATLLETKKGRFQNTKDKGRENDSIVKNSIKMIDNNLRRLAEEQEGIKQQIQAQQEMMAQQAVLQQQGQQSFNGEPVNQNSDMLQQGMRYGGVMQYRLGGGIYIKPENRGKFTAYAKSNGMGVQEMANKVLANREDYSPTIVKRANFVHNASQWNNKYGGMLPKYALGGFPNPDLMFGEEPPEWAKKGYKNISRQAFDNLQGFTKEGNYAWRESNNTPTVATNLTSQTPQQYIQSLVASGKPITIGEGGMIGKEWGDYVAKNYPNTQLQPVGQQEAYKIGGINPILSKDVIPITPRPMPNIDIKNPYTTVPNVTDGNTPNQQFNIGQLGNYQGISAIPSLVSGVTSALNQKGYGIKLEESPLVYMPNMDAQLQRVQDNRALANKTLSNRATSLGSLSSNLARVGGETFGQDSQIMQALNNEAGGRASQREGLAQGVKQRNVDRMNTYNRDITAFENAKIQSINNSVQNALNQMNVNKRDKMAYEQDMKQSMIGLVGMGIPQDEAEKIMVQVYGQNKGKKVTWEDVRKQAEKIKGKTNALGGSLITNKATKVQSLSGKDLPLSNTSLASNWYEGGLNLPISSKSSNEYKFPYKLK